jgi:RNA polymerase sigma-B factor
MDKKPISEGEGESIMSKNQEALSPKRKKWQYSLILQYQKTKSKRLAEKLMIVYGHLAGATARKLSRNHPDLYEDLLQVGRLSLLRSLERYDRSHGASFEAYASKNIKGSIMNYLRDKAWMMPMPRWMKDHWVKVQRAVDELTMKKENTPSIQEVAHHTKLPVELTKKVLTSQTSYLVTSFDAPLDHGKGEYTLGDVIGEEAMEYQAVETRLDMGTALASLSEREKHILHLNFLEGESQRTIAHRLGVSQMTVSRIIRQALEKLKQSLFHPVPSIR